MCFICIANNCRRWEKKCVTHVALSLLAVFSRPFIECNESMHMHSATNGRNLVIFRKKMNQLSGHMKHVKASLFISFVIPLSFALWRFSAFSSLLRSFDVHCFLCPCVLLLSCHFPFNYFRKILIEAFAQLISSFFLFPIHAMLNGNSFDGFCRCCCCRCNVLISLWRERAVDVVRLRCCDWRTTKEWTTKTAIDSVDPWRDACHAIQQTRESSNVVGIDRIVWRWGMQWTMETMDEWVK